MYKCGVTTCNKEVSQVYGTRIDNKFVEVCVKCMFPPRKNSLSTGK